MVRKVPAYRFSTSSSTSSWSSLLSLGSTSYRLTFPWKITYTIIKRFQARVPGTEGRLRTSHPGWGGEDRSTAGFGRTAPADPPGKSTLNDAWSRLLACCRRHRATDRWHWYDPCPLFYQESTREERIREDQQGELQETRFLRVRKQTKSKPVIPYTKLIIVVAFNLSM